MRHEELNDQFVASLAASEDDHGWLSIYLDASPQRQASSPPAWVAPVRAGLNEVVEAAKEDGPRERWKALTECIDALDDALADLLDPRTAGRGRALFVPVSGGEPILVITQVAFRDLVAFQRSPVIGPLVVAYDRHRPVGVIAVHKAGVYVAEHRLGEVEEVAGASFWIDTGDWREMKGPAGANPALPQQSSSQTDKFDRRLEEHRSRRLRGLREVLQPLAVERSWERLFLVGDPRLTKVLRDELAPAGRDGGLDIIEVEKISPEPDALELAELISQEVDRTEQERQHRLVERTLEAVAADAGTAGREHVLTAFLAGRVERVVVPEDELTDDLIRAALETSADVAVVEGEAAARLGDNGGVAARLRW